jgi:putative addiction module component (TIGR02574 family)
MNARVDHLLHEALELPDDERSALVVALLDSLEGSADPSISEAWRDEVRNRRKALREGTIQSTPWPEAKARLSAL